MHEKNLTGPNWKIYNTNAVKLTYDVVILPADSEGGARSLTVLWIRQSVTVRTQLKKLLL